MRRRTLLAATPALMASPGTMRAEEAPGAVDLLLVLAVDVSSSIEEVEARLQRQGYGAALTDPAVLDCIRMGPLAAIGLAYVEWSGVEDQRLVLPWARIAAAAEADAWAAAPVRQPLRFGRGTSIAGGIDFARGVLDRAPWPTGRRVIGVSGDGVSNGSLAVEEARDRAVAAGITSPSMASSSAMPPTATPPRRPARSRRITGGPSRAVPVPSWSRRRVSRGSAPRSAAS